MTDLPPDAALIVARWCWPEECQRNETRCDLVVSNGTYALSVFDPTCFGSGNFMLDTRAAELVIIERGLAEEYGRTLAIALGFNECGEAMMRNDVCSFTRTDYVNAADCALLATAPLDARIRAMLAVIQAHPPHSAAGQQKETK